jgi:hypothetical protein
VSNRLCTSSFCCSILANRSSRTSRNSLSIRSSCCRMQQHAAAEVVAAWISHSAGSSSSSSSSSSSGNHSSISKAVTATVAQCVSGRCAVHCALLQQKATMAAVTLTTMHTLQLLTNRLIACYKDSPKRCTHRLYALHTHTAHTTANSYRKYVTKPIVNAQMLTLVLRSIAILCT